MFVDPSYLFPTKKGFYKKRLLNCLFLLQIDTKEGKKAVNKENSHHPTPKLTKLTLTLLLFCNKIQAPHHQ